VALDLANLEEFEWDSGNARKNDKHGVSREETEQVFFNHPLLLVEDPKHSQTEPRYHALGKSTEGRLLHVSFTVRGGKRIRVISARPMHWKEKTIYAEASQTAS